jgi:hypothetical protein
MRIFVATFCFIPPSARRNFVMCPYKPVLKLDVPWAKKKESLRNTAPFYTRRYNATKTFCRLFLWLWNVVTYLKEMTYITSIWKQSDRVNIRGWDIWKKGTIDAQYHNEEPWDFYGLFCIVRTVNSLKVQWGGPLGCVLSFGGETYWKASSWKTEDIRR